MSLLPSRGPDTSTSQEGELQVVGVDDEVAPLLDALNSETARAILNEIYAEPGTPSEIADRLDMSIQKVSYHIEKLDDQDLIEVAGTQYSEKGQEMTVYQPPDEPTVLFVGTEDRKRSLTTMVKRLLPVVGILALGSLVIEQLFGSFPSFALGAGSGGADGGESGGSGDAGGSGGDGGFTGASDGANASGSTVTETATETPTPTDAPTETTSGGGDIGIMEVTETGSATSTPRGTEAATGEQIATETQGVEQTTVETAAETSAGTDAYQSTELTQTPAPETTDVATETTAQAADLAASGGFEISPGVAFFLGGLTVLVVLSVWWAYTN